MGISLAASSKKNGLSGFGARSKLPVAAQLATTPIGLIAFAQKAGRNMLHVIPDETRTQLYLRGQLNIHWICDPEIVTELLIGQGRHFPKAKFTKDILGPAVGNGLMLAEGEKWKVQRRRYSPLFAARNLPMIAKHFARTGEVFAASSLAEGAEVDIARLSQEATLTNISNVIFSGTETVEPEVIRACMKRFFAFIAKISLFDLMGFPDWVPRLKWLRSKAPVTSIRDLARQVIESRRAEGRSEPQDFLDLMIETLEDQVEDIDTTIDNLLTFVVAGHETAANTMAWGLYLLARYPDVQSRLRQEVLSAVGQGEITYESLAKMPRLLSHVRETLRLYPAGAFFARDAAAEVTIKGVTFAKGDALFFPVYSLHRHEMLWEEPDNYLPERFLDFRPQRGQYIPFGDGPRICIGAQYAETEIMVLMAALLRRVELDMSDKPIPEPVLTFTMRPGGPMMLKVRAVQAG